MFRTLDRYVFRETAAAWATVTGVLLAILLSNQFARVLGDAAKDKLPKEAVFGVIGLTALQYLTILIPVGLFLAIMLALARLYRDSELPAMMACRVGPGGLYRPLGWLALPLAALVAWLALAVGPQALRQVALIGAEAQRQIDLGAIEPGRFTRAGDGGAVVYAERVSEDGALSNVFLQRRAGERLEIVLAERGRQRETGDPDTRYIVLENGRRYEGVPGERNFQIFEFREHGIPYALPSADQPELEPEARPTLELVRALERNGDRAAMAELQWRLSLPLSALALSLLAVPLSRSRPREGRYGKLAIGVLLYIIYFNLLGAAKAWVEQGVLAPALGLWWVHGLVILLALVLLGWQNGVFSRLLRRAA